MALRTDREKCAHLLRRFGLGASEAELDFYLKDGLKGAIDQLLAYEEVEEAADLDIESLRNDNGNLNVPNVASWWGYRILSTRRPLQEKMTLFWHDHFATSASKVTQAPLMYQQNVVLREHATGKFERLLLAASQDPAMLFWLDNQFNVRGKPNENFAREIMELFTLGIGHYSEQDVQEAARAFTGWTIGRNTRDNPGVLRASFIFRPALHDAGIKEVLGNRGRFSGEEVISLLCSNPQTSLYLTTKIWEWFAYPSPEPALIERLAKKFSDSGLDVQVLLRAVMESSEFYSDKAERKIYKTPVDFTVPTMRQLGVGEAIANVLKNSEPERVRARLVPVVAMTQACTGMGMKLLFPPDVAGWDGGPAWISSGTMVERIKWADLLFGQAAGAATGGRRAQVQYQSIGLYQKDPSPQGVVDTLLSIYDAPLPASKRTELVAAAQRASGGRVTPATANATSAAVSRLIFGSPEFQFA